MKFHCMLKKLQLHKEEYVLMQAISLFSPGDGSPQLLAPQSSAGGSSSLPRQGLSHHKPCFPLHRQTAVFCLLVWGGRPAVSLSWAGLSFLCPSLPCLAPQCLPFSSLPFSDRPGVVQRSVVDQLQERFALTLKAYIECSRPYPAHR